MFVIRRCRDQQVDAVTVSSDADKEITSDSEDFGALLQGQVEGGVHGDIYPSNNITI